MNGFKKNILRLVVAALPVLLQGCGTLAAPQILALSMASTIAGGYANGGLMAGSTVGVIRNVAFGDGDGTEPQVIVPVAKTAVAANDSATPTTVAVATAGREGLHHAEIRQRGGCQRFGHADDCGGSDCGGREGLHHAEIRQRA